MFLYHWNSEIDNTILLQGHQNAEATGGVLWKKCSKKFRKFHRKTPALDSLFNKVSRLQACNFVRKRLQYRCFLVGFAKFIITLFFWRIDANGCFLKGKGFEQLVNIGRTVEKLDRVV